MIQIKVLPRHVPQTCIMPDDVASTRPDRQRVFVPPAPVPDEAAADVIRSDVIDRLMHAWQGRFTASITPAGLMAAFFDWGAHLANAPGKQAALVEKAIRKWVRLAIYLSKAAGNPDCPPCIEPLPQD